MVVFSIVIYKISLSDCITFKTLLDCLGLRSTTMFRVLVLDNSEVPDYPPPSAPYLDYFAFHNNVGLARATSMR